MPKQKFTVAEKAAIMQGAASDLVVEYKGEANDIYAKMVEDAFSGVPDESLARLYDILMKVGKA